MTKGTASSGRNLAARRSRSILVVTVVFLLVAAAQLFMIQIVRGDELAEQGRVVRTSASAIQAPRGSIVDANDVVLVESHTTYHIAANQKALLEYRNVDDNGVIVGRGPAEAARQLAPILGMDVAELGGMLLGDSTYQYLAKNVEPDTYREIRRLGIYGIEWEPSFDRLYPGGSLAGTVLGSVDVAGDGNSGLELIFQDALTGEPGEESYEIGPTGAVIPGAKVVSKEAQPGDTVNTTLVADLQYAVQSELDAAVDQHGAEWGAAVVMDVASAEILALADSDTTTPENGPQASKAVQMVYEPGSVGKIFTFAGALERGVITPESTFTMADKYTTSNGQTFSDMVPHETFTKTATGIIAQSLNTGTVMIGEQIPAEDRYELMRRFGLGEKTGVQLAGESAGILSSPEDWDGRTFYTTTFGQGYAINAVQAASVMATLGNGGVRIAPTLVSGFTAPDGTVQELDRGVPTEVVQPEVAQTLVKMLESVTNGGSGYLANVDGYRVAAKTGTSEIGTGGTIANMVALFPADNPQVAISTILYKPTGLYKGSETAAPLVHQIVTDCIRVLGIPPSKEAPALFPSDPGA